MESDTRTEYFPQWFNARRSEWITPTDWLRRGGYPTIEEARTTGAAYCRSSAPNVRVRIVRRVVTETVLSGEVPAPSEH